MLIVGGEVLISGAFDVAAAVRGNRHEFQWLRKAPPPNLGTWGNAANHRSVQPYDSSERIDDFGEQP